ncbi:MAG: hypothetical protein GY839_11280 [candidate division Zixibacteria bacterium]|nr:hypothetical protein [candidate division Zixibacteria bacterium]
MWTDWKKSMKWFSILTVLEKILLFIIFISFLAILPITLDISYLYWGLLVVILIIIELIQVTLFMWIFLMDTSGSRKESLRYIKIWRNFTNSLPKNLTNEISQYSPILIMGENDHSARRLIDTYTDWQNFLLKRNIKYEINDKLPIYVIHRNIVISLPDSFHKESSYTKHADMKELISALSSHPNPRLLIVLDIEKGFSLSEKATTAHFEKFNDIITTFCGAIGCDEISIALTSMNKLHGYDSFIEYFANKKMPVEMIARLDETPDIGKNLSVYEQYLSSALTSISADDFLDILSFFQEAPKHLTFVNHYIRKFSYYGFLKRVRVFFTSDKGHEINISNPFDGRSDQRSGRFSRIIRGK